MVSKKLEINQLIDAPTSWVFPTDWSREHFITPEREQAILGHTPMARYGRLEELVGAMLRLVTISMKSADQKDHKYIHPRVNPWCSVYDHINIIK
jgi:hypothetical protein